MQLHQISGISKGNSPVDRVLDPDVGRPNDDDGTEGVIDDVQKALQPRKHWHLLVRRPIRPEESKQKEIWYEKSCVFHHHYAVKKLLDPENAYRLKPLVHEQQHDKEQYPGIYEESNTILADQLVERPGSVVVGCSFAAFVCHEPEGSNRRSKRAEQSYLRRNRRSVLDI